MYRKLTTLALAVAILVGGLTFGNSRVAAQQGGNPRVAFLGNLVALFANDVIDLSDTTAQVGLVNVSRSLNNLRALNNLLRAADIDVDIIDDVTLTDVNVLSIDESTVLNNFLNANNIDLAAVVGVILFGSDMIVVTDQRG